MSDLNEDYLDDLQLDPKPWVSWGVRYARNLGTTYFEPRPEYSQNKEDYR